MKQVILFLIRLYQATLSPDHGWLKAAHPYGHCRFYPSCSQYAQEAINKKGVIAGAGLALWRVLRCNPWNKGGIDLVK